MQPTLLNLSSQDTSLHTTLIVTYVCALNFSRKHGETTVSQYGEAEVLNYRTDGLVILSLFFFNFFNVESKKIIQMNLYTKQK